MCNFLKPILFVYHVAEFSFEQRDSLPVQSLVYSMSIEVTQVATQVKSLIFGLPSFVNAHSINHLHPLELLLDHSQWFNINNVISFRIVDLINVNDKLALLFN